MTVMTSSNAPRQAPPRTQYIYVTNSGGPSSSGGGGRWGRAVGSASARLGQGARQATVPRPLPTFLGNQRVVVYAWGVSMAIIAVDEWKRHEILPRPARLWWASLFYGMLALAGMFEAAIPLVNAFAIGYMIMLAYQFWNKEGQFSG